MSRKPFRSLVAAAGVSLILSAGAAMPTPAFSDTWRMPMLLNIACKWEPAGLTAPQKSALETYCSLNTIEELDDQFPDAEASEKWWQDAEQVMEAVIRDGEKLVLVPGEISAENPDTTVRGYGFQPGESVTLEVVDGDGQVVQSVEMGTAEDDLTFEGPFTFDASLPAGVYEVRLSDEWWHTASTQVQWGGPQPVVTPSPTPAEEVPGSSPSPTPAPSEEAPSPAPTPAEEVPGSSPSPTPTPTEDTPSPVPTTEAPSPAPTPAEEVPGSSPSPTPALTEETPVDVPAQTSPSPVPISETSSPSVSSTSATSEAPAAGPVATSQAPSSDSSSDSSSVSRSEGPVSDAARTLADTGGAGLFGVIVAGAALAGGGVMLRRR